MGMVVTDKIEWMYVWVLEQNKWEMYASCELGIYVYATRYVYVTSMCVWDLGWMMGNENSTHKTTHTPYRYILCHNKLHTCVLSN